MGWKMGKCICMTGMKHSEFQIKVLAVFTAVVLFVVELFSTFGNTEWLEWAEWVEGTTENSGKICTDVVTPKGVPLEVKEKVCAVPECVVSEPEVPQMEALLPEEKPMEPDNVENGVFSGTIDISGEESISDENEMAGGLVPEGETDDPMTEEGDAGSPVLVNGFLVDSEGMICGMDAAMVEVIDGYLELPSEYCTGIRSGALVENGAGIVEVYVPSNLTVIEEGAFSNLYCLEWIEVSGENPEYMSRDGVLFDGSGSTLLVFPGGRVDMYSIPENVTRIADGAFANTCIYGLDFWKCDLVEIGEDVFGEHLGAGIEIRVPDEYTDWYQNAFAEYKVQIL